MPRTVSAVAYFIPEHTSRHPFHREQHWDSTTPSEGAFPQTQTTLDAGALPPTQQHIASTEYQPLIAASTEEAKAAVGRALQLLALEGSFTVEQVGLISTLEGQRSIFSSQGGMASPNDLREGISSAPEGHFYGTEDMVFGGADMRAILVLNSPGRILPALETYNPVCRTRVLVDILYTFTATTQDGNSVVMNKHIDPHQNNPSSSFSPVCVLKGLSMPRVYGVDPYAGKEEGGGMIDFVRFNPDGNIRCFPLVSEERDLAAVRKAIRKCVTDRLEVQRAQQVAACEQLMKSYDVQLVHHQQHGEGHHHHHEYEGGYEEEEEEEGSLVRRHAQAVMDGLGEEEEEEEEVDAVPEQLTVTPKHGPTAPPPHRVQMCEQDEDDDWLPLENPSNETTPEKTEEVVSSARMRCATAVPQPTPCFTASPSLRMDEASPFLVTPVDQATQPREFPCFTRPPPPPIKAPRGPTDDYHHHHHSLCSVTSQTPTGSVLFHGEGSASIPQPNFDNDHDAHMISAGLLGGCTMQQSTATATGSSPLPFKLVDEGFLPHTSLRGEGSSVLFPPKQSSILMTNTTSTTTASSHPTIGTQLPYFVNSASQQFSRVVKTRESTESQNCAQLSRPLPVSAGSITALRSFSSPQHQPRDPKGSDTAMSSLIFDEEGVVTTGERNNAGHASNQTGEHLFVDSHEEMSQASDVQQRKWPTAVSHGETIGTGYRCPAYSATVPEQPHVLMNKHQSSASAMHSGSRPETQQEESVSRTTTTTTWAQSGDDNALEVHRHLLLPQTQLAEYESRTNSSTSNRSCRSRSEELLATYHYHYRPPAYGEDNQEDTHLTGRLRLSPHSSIVG